jgi:hypothetical protein
VLYASGVYVEGVGLYATVHARVYALPVINLVGNLLQIFERSRAWRPERVVLSEFVAVEKSEAQFSRRAQREWLEAAERLA